MTTFVGVYLIGLAAVIGLIVLYQAYTGAHELLTVRNVAVLGFIIFQVTSGATHLITGRNPLFRVTDPDAAGVVFAAMCTVFFFVAMLAYHVGPGIKRPARWLAQSKPVAGERFQIAMAICLTVLAVVFRFAVFIPHVAIVSNMIGVGFSAVACGLAGWYWASRMVNPAVWVFVFIILGLNVLAMVWGEFGRRNLVAVLGGLIWGVYYARWRYLPLRSLAGRPALLSVFPVILLALYTSVRSADEHDRTAFDHLREIRSSGDALAGLTLLLDGQGTASASLWCIENFPENYEYEHLLTPRYFFMIPVPRAWWPDKPEPLSTKLATWAKLNQISRDKVKLPAGIIGNAAAEGGWYAVFVYAILAGCFLRFFDEIVRCNPLSPFVVLPVGCQLGQVLGLARGEVSIFAMTYVLSFIGVWFSMSMVARLLVRAGVGPVDEVYDEESWHHEHAA